MLPWLREPEENLESSPNEEVSPSLQHSPSWQEQGGVMSCGGVYLGFNRAEVPSKDHFEFVAVPNRFRNTLVLNHGEIHQSSLSLEKNEVAPSAKSSWRDPLKRFFRENLN